MYTRITLANAQKGNMTMPEYFGKIRGLADEMAAAGKPLDKEDIVSYVLAGLDGEYNSIVTSMATRVEPVSVSELYAQLLSFEMRLDLLQGGNAGQSFVNAATRGGRGGGPGRGGGRGGPPFPGRGNGGPGGNYGGQNGNGGYNGHGGRGGYGGSYNHGGGGHGNHGGGNGHGNYGGNPRSNGGGNKPRCQLCGKLGHTVGKCWERFNPDFNPVEEKSAASATTSYGNYGAYGADSNPWHIDTGTTDQITGDLHKLTICDKYASNEQVYAANGPGKDIKHIGQSTVSTYDRDLHLKNILHVPQSSKSLLSAHRLAFDNNAFVEIHPNSFFIKDQATRRTLLQGRCRRGLYSLSSIPSSSSKQVLGVIKPSSERWHARLGHPSLAIVKKIISQNKLLCSSDFDNDSVCDACQKGKSHQLPYPKSFSESSAPLELIFSDVWGSCP